MLENNQDNKVVRWGDEGNSFVVLEVRPSRLSGLFTDRAEREIHKIHPPEALQA